MAAIRLVDCWALNNLFVMALNNITRRDVLNLFNCFNCFESLCYSVKNTCHGIVENRPAGVQTGAPAFSKEQEKRHLQDCDRPSS